jgi:hypothetical protein
VSARGSLAKLTASPAQRRGKRHISPDVFVVFGVPNRHRDADFVWKEGKGPDGVFEFTAPSTEDEDLGQKFHLYQDALEVPEYVLFDPRGEYLDPPLQGYRLVAGRYQRIEPVAGRLPSASLGLHLAPVGKRLRLFDPATRRHLLTAAEARQVAEAERAHAEAERAHAEAERAHAEAERPAAEQRAVQRAEQLRQVQLEREQRLQEVHALPQRAEPMT